MAEIRWHIIKKDGNPTKDGKYLVTTRDEWFDGEYFYYGTGTLEFADGWNCHRRADGTVGREYEIKGIYAWADIEHLYDDLPKRKEKKK